MSKQKRAQVAFRQGGEPPLPTPRPPEPPAQAVVPPGPPRVAHRLFVVERETRVPRGSTYYTLPAGKVISSKGYDVDHLLRIGVPLRETIEPPSREPRAIVR